MPERLHVPPPTLGTSGSSAAFGAAALTFATTDSAQPPFRTTPGCCTVSPAQVPPIIVAAWLVLRLGVCVCDLVFVMKPVPIFLDTPWELLQSWYLLFHGVKVVDADGANTWRLPDVRNIEGCVLTNHRSWGDFVFDPAMAFAPVVARTAAVAATMLAGLIGLMCGKVQGQGQG